MSPPEQHAYGDGGSQFAELFRPAAAIAERLPVAVVIHGGFWKAQYDRRLMHSVCADLASRGWAAWNLEYRRLEADAAGTYAATLEDVAAGIDALAAVQPPDLDLGEVVAIGHSAGGQLALWAASRIAARVRLRAVVGQAAVSDLRLAAELRLSDGVVERFLGGTPAAIPDRYAEASPAERLPLRIPILLTHGGRDEDVPALMSERFAAAARAAGDTVTLQHFDDEGHMGHVDPGNPMWQAVAEWIR